MNRVTPDIVRKAKGQGIAALTAYDYPTARLLDEAGHRRAAGRGFYGHGRLGSS